MGIHRERVPLRLILGFGLARLRLAAKPTFAFAWLLLGNILHFAYCGLVGNPHLTANLPTSTKFAWGFPNKSGRPPLLAVGCCWAARRLRCHDVFFGLFAPFAEQPDRAYGHDFYVALLDPAAKIVNDSLFPLGLPGLPTPNFKKGRKKRGLTNTPGPKKHHE